MSSDGGASDISDVDTSTSTPSSTTNDESIEEDTSSTPSSTSTSDSEPESIENDDDATVSGSSNNGTSGSESTDESDDAGDGAASFSSKLDNVNFILVLHLEDFTRWSYMVNMLLVAIDAEQTRSVSSLVAKYGEKRHPDGDAYITRRLEKTIVDEVDDTDPTDGDEDIVVAEEEEVEVDALEVSDNADPETAAEEANINDKKHVLIILIADSSYYKLPLDPALYIRDQIKDLHSKFDIAIDMIAVSPYNAATQQLWDKAKSTTDIEQAMTLSFWHRAYCKSTKRMIVDLPSLLIMLIGRFPLADMHMMEGSKKRGTEHFSYSHYVNNGYNLPPGIVQARRPAEITVQDEITASSEGTIDETYTLFDHSSSSTLSSSSQSPSLIEKPETHAQ